MKAILFRHPWWFLGVIIITILSALADVYFAFVLKHVVDVSSKTPEVFSEVMVGALFFLVLATLLAFLRKGIEGYYIKKTLVSFKEKIFSGQVSLGISEFNNKNTAEYISCLTNDITMVEQDYILNILEIIDNVFIFTISVSSLVFLNTKVTIAVLVFAILPLVIPLLFKKVLSKRKLVYSSSLGNFTSKMKDTFSGFEVVKGFRIKEYAKDSFNQANEKVEGKKFTFKLLQSLVESLGTGAGSLMHLMAIGFGAYFVARGEMTFGDLLAMIQLMSFVVNPIVQVANRVNKINATQGIVDKLLIYTKKAKDDLVESDLVFEKSLRMDNVSFSFGNKRVLKNISFAFEKGKKYALIGQSGSGKSTLLKLLLNYYTVDEGTISMDGMTYETLNDDIYHVISPIHQNVYMFDDTIEANIRLYSHYDDQTVEKVIDQACLRNLIKAKPNGKFEQVGENGNVLSGGEKQRIAIARGLIKDTNIILADEATSALDKATAKQIEDHLLGTSGKTLIAVTHKLDAQVLKRFDTLILMEDGEIIVSGSFDQVKKSPQYIKFSQQEVENVSNTSEWI